MNLWSGVNGSVFRLYENGTLISTKLLTPNSPKAQVATVDVAGKPNGTYVYTGELINAKGATATTSVTVKVKDAAPAVPGRDPRQHRQGRQLHRHVEPVVGHERHELQAVRERRADRPAVAGRRHRPGAQQVATHIAGRAPGTYTYVAEFANAAGATQSKPVAVTVR